MVAKSRLSYRLEVFLLQPYDKEGCLILVEYKAISSGVPQNWGLRTVFILMEQKKRQAQRCPGSSLLSSVTQ